MILNLFSSLLLSLIFCSSTLTAQSNKILHLDLNAGLIIGNYAYPNLEAGISVDFDVFTAKISHSHSFGAIGNESFYWDRQEVEVKELVKFNSDLNYTNFSLFTNLNLLGYNLFLGPGFYYRHQYYPESNFKDYGTGLSFIGGYRFGNFNLTGNLFLPFFDDLPETIVKLGYRFGLGKDRESPQKKIGPNYTNPPNEVAQNRFRIEVGGNYSKAFSNKFTSLSIKSYVSLQYYPNERRKLYISSTLQNRGGKGADEFLFTLNIVESGDTFSLRNLRLLGAQLIYRLGYNFILKRDNRNNLDFEMGGGLFATRSRDRNFIKEAWNVNTNGFGIFANAQYRYKMFATGLNINLPVVNSLPASISIYSSIGINFKQGGVLSKIFKRKKKD